MVDPQGYFESVLANYAPHDGQETESLCEMRTVAPDLDELWGDSGPTHVTGSAIIVDSQYEQCLLLKHKRLGIWLQPGGHVALGEFPYEAAIREAEEETGLSFHHWHDEPTLVHLDAHDGPRGHRHFDLRYLLVTEHQQPQPPKGESQEVSWFVWDDALAITDVSCRSALIQARAVVISAN